MATKTYAYTDEDNQIWLKNDAGESSNQVWTFTVAGIPAGSRIDSVKLSFGISNTYNAPSRVSVYKGSGTNASNRVWTEGSSYAAGSKSVDLTSQSFITGNGSYSLTFYAACSSSYAHSYVCFSSIKIVIEYTVLKSTFSLSADSVSAGEALGVSISCADPAYTHNVTIALGSRTYTEKEIADSLTYIIPLAWLDQLPNVESGTATVTVETISGSTSLGSVSAYVTVLCPEDIVPTVGTILATQVDGLWDMYIQTHSRCKITVSDYAPGAGATIASIHISGNGNSVWADEYTSDELRTAGENVFTVTVKDSRGRSAQGTVSIMVEAYSPVAILSKTAYRCDAQGNEDRENGRSVMLGCSYEMTSVGENAATVQVFWREYRTETWTELADWPNESGTLQVALTDSIAMDAQYEFRFVVSDAVSRAEQISQMPAAVAFMVWSKARECIGLGAFPTQEKSLTLAQGWSLIVGGRDVGNAIRKRDRVRNLLDNSDFRNPVNQRGQTSYSADSTYCFDRWIFQNFNNNSGTTGPTTGCIWLSSAAEDGAVALIQRIPIDKVMGLEGKACTFCYENDAGEIHSASLILGNQPDGVSCGSLIIFSTAFTDDYAALYIRAYGVNENGIKWVALYPGKYTADTLPEYIPKGYTAELLECQRYYLKLEGSANVSYPAYTVSTTQTDVTIPVAVPMRVTPTLTVGDVGGISVYAPSSANTATAVVVQNRRNHAIALRVTVDLSTAWRVACARFYTDVELSADL